MFSESQEKANSAPIATFGPADSMRHYRTGCGLVREPDPGYPDPRVCFLCGEGDGVEPLVGSSPLCDWVHPGCLKRPIVWD